jgi:hypothetical protein
VWQVLDAGAMMQPEYIGREGVARPRRNAHQAVPVAPLALATPLARTPP